MIVMVPLEDEMSIREPSVLVILSPSPFESVVSIGGTQSEGEAMIVPRE